MICSWWQTYYTEAKDLYQKTTVIKQVKHGTQITT